MKSALAVGGIALLVALGSAAHPFGTASARAARYSSHQVMVHCPNGGREAFVTPPSLTIAVGDSVEWRMTGQVASDSIVISLKNPDQAWPFAGRVARGGTSARTGSARTTGTYRYNVSLLCRQPNGELQPVVIDPDIIIE